MVGTDDDLSGRTSWEAPVGHRLGVPQGEGHRDLPPKTTEVPKQIFSGSGKVGGVGNKKKNRKKILQESLDSSTMHLPPYDAPWETQ